MKSEGLMSERKIKTLSLFSGAGGLDIGFHQAGYDIVACVELEKKYAKTLEHNKRIGKYFSADTEIHNTDIRDFDVTPYLDLGIECVIGGPPCQTFSAAGRRSGGVIGTDDERGQLYEVYCQILDSLKPKVFIFENVYGLPGANGGEPWKEILRAFSEHGYDIEAQVLDTADYGVPQHRERLIMVGTKGQKYKFPLPIVGPDSVNGQSLVSVYDVIKDLQSDDEKYHDGLGGLYGHLLPEIPEGLNYAFFTAEMGHPEPIFAWRSKFHDLLYKVDKNRPCRTIKANPGKFTGPFHWKNRHFTAAELKRLQTFPDEYEIVGSYGHVLEQIGNSVPPKLAKVIAVSVREQVLRPQLELELPIREPDFKSTFRQRQRERSKKFKVVAKNAIERQYGEIKRYEDSASVKPFSSTYYSCYQDKFSRELFTRKPSNKDRFFQCTLTETVGHVRIDVDEKSKLATSESFEVAITIKGLKKYLPKFESLKLSSTIVSLDSVFCLWREIEAALTERSRFYTLIDIYGHYANRGDVVEVDFSIKNNNALMESMLAFFSKTENCGEFINEQYLCREFNINKPDLGQAIQLLRDLRFDIRTYDSHPIIGSGNILCTYPFPLLSKKALVKSKAKLNKEKIHERQARLV